MLWIAGTLAGSALAGDDAADVGQPHAAGSGRLEALRQDVGRYRQMVAAVGRARPEAPACTGADAVTAHQAFNAATAATMPFGPQGAMHPRAAVTPVAPRLKTSHVG